MPRSAIPRTGLPLIERVVDDARIALCAEAVGAMDESLKTTVEYLKTRKQFGVPIGSSRRLQHRAADMFVARRAGAQHVDVRDHGGRFRRTPRSAPTRSPPPRCRSASR